MRKKVTKGARSVSPSARPPAGQEHARGLMRIDKVSREKMLNDMEKVLNAMLLARGEAGGGEVGARRPGVTATFLALARRHMCLS